MDTKIVPVARTTPTPFFDSLQKEMERVFDRFRFTPTLGDAGFGVTTAGQIMPALDISETDDMVEITVEVPGVNEDDLDVTINGDMLTLKGEKSSGRDENDASYHLVERRYGSFQRTVSLGFTPTDESVTANFKAGVLKLTIKKPPEAKAAVRKVKIGKA